jgi:hypothetical protein
MTAAVRRYFWRIWRGFVIDDIHYQKRQMSKQDTFTGSARSTCRVFISYSHDSIEHARRVLELAERLRADGVDANLDQYVPGTPAKGWPRWMDDQMDWAEFVLVICTETYHRRFLGREEPDRGTGVDWEGSLITLELYHARSDTRKFVPVLFVPEDKPFIPMKTIITSNSRPLRRAPCTVLIGIAALWAMPRNARAQFYVSQVGNDAVGEYNATTGAAINPSFITGLNGPYGLALSGNDLCVANVSGQNCELG